MAIFSKTPYRWTTSLDSSRLFFLQWNGLLIIHCIYTPIESNSRKICVLLHMIDIVIQLTCIIFDLLSSTKFMQNGIVRIIVVNL